LCPAFKTPPDFFLFDLVCQKTIIEAGKEFKLGIK
jgi:hypothetical protein